MIHRIFVTRTVSREMTKSKVLVVEDDESLAQTYSEILQPEYDVKIVHTGKGAIEALDFDPDVILLDRRLKEISGDEVLDHIRTHNIDARVAMMTAVDPDFDIIEMEFDDYLTKPLARNEILEVVESLLDTGDLQAKKRELSSKKIKRNVLEIEKSPAELAETEEFRQLEERIEQLETEIATLETDNTESIKTEAVEGSARTESR